MDGDGSAASATISVVIPVKDDDDELRRCLRALASQTRPPDEIVVVDNDSTDASAEVARSAGARVEQCGAPGIPAAASRGYDCARGDLILRLDADCIPGPTWVQDMADAFARRPDVAAFTGGARFIDGPRPLRAPLVALYLGAYVLTTSSALGHLPLFGSNLGMRAEVWRSIRSRVHRDDPGIHDDLDLAYHLGERHRIRVLRGAAMGISMRPFFPGRAFGRRMSAGWRTVLIHWPADLPPVRWTRHALRRLRSRIGGPR
ncbi:glycosyltransferase family A protein [Microbacterium aureliae]